MILNRREQVSNFRVDSNPSNCFDVVTQIPGKRIVVIGVQHGNLGHPFPGRQQAELLLQKYFPQKNISGMVVDSFSQVELYPDAYAIKSTVQSTIPDNQLDFFQWAIRYAAGKNLWMIGADFNNANSNMTAEITDHDTAIVNAAGPRWYENQAAEVYNSANSSLQVDERTDALIQNGTDLIGLPTLGILIFYGAQLLESERRISRRAVAKGAWSTAEAVAGAAIAAAGISALQGVRGFLHRRDIMLQQERDKTLRNDGFNPVYGGDTQDMGDNAFINDLARRKRLLAQDLLSQNTCADPALQRIANENATDFSIQDVFRNAIIAEILSLPNDTILPNLGIPLAEIACMMGYDHLDIIPEYTINSLIMNPTKRRSIIRTGIKAIMTAVDSGYFPDINRIMVKGKLENMGRSYKISQGGQLQTVAFPVPYLNQVTAQY